MLHKALVTGRQIFRVAVSGKIVVHLFQKDKRRLHLDKINTVIKFFGWYYQVSF